MNVAGLAKILETGRGGMKLYEVQFSSAGDLTPLNKNAGHLL